MTYELNTLTNNRHDDALQHAECPWIDRAAADRNNDQDHDNDDDTERRNNNLDGSATFAHYLS